MPPDVNTFYGTLSDGLYQKFEYLPGDFGLPWTLRNLKMADGVRFELTKGLHPRRFSRPVLSTTQPPIRSALGSRIKTLFVYVPDPTQGVNREVKHNLTSRPLEAMEVVVITG